ncbi:hypothetical protein ACO1G0_09405 [Fusobacterium watanabei]|jgi:hypothetical protein|uniref:hypothetical protein n=1 Tax=Fusobacterium TaxID=848 RepID=UPI00235F3506|nr:hypothetical protein [Fusobacterium nucleatum]WDA46114.1 hypothetical protein PSR67_00975 [Fusobacterium nucleatum]
MKIKEMLLISLSIASLVACSNNTTNNEDRDAMKILEEKREYYEKQDKEKAKVEEVKAMQMTEAENAGETVVEEDSKMQEDEAKLEAERVKNMTADEKMIYRVDKAKEKIDAMLETAKKARQEELDVGETKAKVEEALKNITEEK